MVSRTRSWTSSSTTTSSTAWGGMRRAAMTINDPPKSNILGELFITKLTPPNIYSWTLTSRLGHMLRQVEQEYGQRDKNYTILGIEFEAGGPRINYRGPEKNDIIIQLGPIGLTNVFFAYWCLAQEVVHLLSPTGEDSANVLEEGLATKFAREYMINTFIWTAPSDSVNYAEADTLASELCTKWPDCVKRMREDEPVISKFTLPLLIHHCPGIEYALATRLLERHGGRE